MKRSLLLLLCSLSLLFSQGGAAAQDASHGGIPDEVYYLIPSFRPGMVYFRGQPPAQGELNICALDHTLRFLGPDGKELVASNIDNVVRVQIDTVFFLHYREKFYRQYPASTDTGVALRRNLRFMTDAKPAAYGGTSMTSSVTEFTSVYADGMTHRLEGRTDYPYDMQENVFIYKEDTVYPVSRKNLKKVYPDKKEEIEAWFKAGNSLPDSVEGLLPILSGWAR